MSIVFFIILLIIAILFLIFTIALIRNGNYVKCPKCGSSMYFDGNILKESKGFRKTTLGEPKHIGYPHVYRCPECGATKVI